MRFIADESCDFAIAHARESLAAEVCAFVQANGDALVDSFSTLQPGRARISRLPA